MTRALCHQTAPPRTWVPLTTDARPIRASWEVKGHRDILVTSDLNVTDAQHHLQLIWKWFQENILQCLRFLRPESLTDGTISAGPWWLCVLGLPVSTVGKRKQDWVCWRCRQYKKLKPASWGRSLQRPLEALRWLRLDRGAGAAEGRRFHCFSDFCRPLRSGYH